MELAWNAQKNQMSDVKGKEMEQERKGKITNQEINLDRTKDNYDLVQSDKNLYNRVKNRVEDLRESGSRVQKNSVVMYSNILTVPLEQADKWGEEKTDEYFKACYDFFSEEFGIQNVVSAKIHKDETAPHMHLHFVPVNKENGKLQARVSMNRAKINYIHDELPKFLRERGFEVERGAGKKEKNIEDIHEYKEVQQLKKEVQLQKQKLDERLEKIEVSQMPLVKLDDIEKRKFEKGIFNKRIELSVDDFQNLVAMGSENLKIRKMNVNLCEQRDDYKNKNVVLKERTQDLVATVNTQKREMGSLENEIITLKEDLDEIRDQVLVYGDILLNDFNMREVSSEEVKARLLLIDIESGQEPRNKKEAQSWKETLEEARETKIEPTRLERAIGMVQEILERFIERVRTRSRGRSR